MTISYYTDPGTEGYLGYAKRMLAELSRVRAAVGAPMMKRNFIVDGNFITILSANIGDRIMIIGTGKIFWTYDNVSTYFGYSKTAKIPEEFRVFATVPQIVGGKEFWIANDAGTYKLVNTGVNVDLGLSGSDAAYFSPGAGTTAQLSFSESARLIYAKLAPSDRRVYNQVSKSFVVVPPAPTIPSYTFPAVDSMISLKNRAAVITQSGTYIDSISTTTAIDRWVALVAEILAPDSAPSFRTVDVSTLIVFPSDPSISGTGGSATAYVNSFGSVEYGISTRFFFADFPICNLNDNVIVVGSDGTNRKIIPAAYYAPATTSMQPKSAFSMTLTRGMQAVTHGIFQATIGGIMNGQFTAYNNGAMITQSIPSGVILSPPLSPNSYSALGKDDVLATIYLTQDIFGLNYTIFADSSGFSQFVSTAGGTGGLIGTFANAPLSGSAPFFITTRTGLSSREIYRISKARGFELLYTASPGKTVSVVTTQSRTDHRYEDRCYVIETTTALFLDPFRLWVASENDFIEVDFSGVSAAPTFATAFMLPYRINGDVSLFLEIGTPEDAANPFKVVRVDQDGKVSVIGNAPEGFLSAVVAPTLYWDT